MFVRSFIFTSCNSVWSLADATLLLLLPVAFGQRNSIWIWIRFLRTTFKLRRHRTRDVCACGFRATDTVAVSMTIDETWQHSHFVVARCTSENSNFVHFVVDFMPIMRVECVRFDLYSASVAVAVAVCSIYSNSFGIILFLSSLRLCPTSERERSEAEREGEKHFVTKKFVCAVVIGHFLLALRNISLSRISSRACVCFDVRMPRSHRVIAIWKFLASIPAVLNIHFTYGSTYATRSGSGSNSITSSSSTYQTSSIVAITVSQATQAKRNNKRMFRASVKLMRSDDIYLFILRALVCCHARWHDTYQPRSKCSEKVRWATVATIAAWRIVLDVGELCLAVQYVSVQSRHGRQSAT